MSPAVARIEKSGGSGHDQRRCGLGTAAARALSECDGTGGKNVWVRTTKLIQR